MNRFRRILAFILALVLVISNLPADTAAAAAVSGDPAGSNQGQTEGSTPSNEAQAQDIQPVVITLTADDTRIHRSNVVNAPALEGGEYRLGIGRSDLWYDYNTRKVIPSIYNLRELMTVKVGTSSDKGINRYPYVVTKVNVKEAGYYDLGVKINMNAATAVNSLAIVVDGTVHVVHPEKTDAKQTVAAQNVYLTAGEHSILYTSVIPQNESEFSLNQARATFDTYYPWTNFWAFTFENKNGAADSLEVLDASSLTGTDVENILKESTRVEAENTQLVRWNIYNKAEINGAASGDTVVGGLYYSQIKQTFTDLAENGLDKAKTPCVHFAVDAPAAGTYYLTVGVCIGTSTNNSNPVPFVAVIVNDNAPVKAQFDGAWNGMDCVTVAVELKQGNNVIYCTSVTPDQYSEGTAWVNYDYIELQKGLTVKRAEVDAADADWADYVYLNSFVDSGSNFGGAYYADFRYDYPSLYEEMLGIYSDAKPDRAGYWPYVALRVNAEAAGYYQICATIETSAAETVGMIVDGATYAVDIASNKVTESVYLTAGEHIIIFTLPMPRDMTVATTTDSALYPWINYCSFKLPAGLSFGDAPTFEAIKNSMQSYSKMEAEDPSGVTATGGYILETSNTYTRRYGDHVVIVKGWRGLVSSTNYVEYKVYADEAGTYVIRVGTYLGGSGDMPYGTVLVNGASYKAQFGGNWNGYDAVNLPVELQKGENTIRLYGVSKDQTTTDGWIGYDFVEIPAGLYFDEPGEYSADHVDKGFTFEKRVTYETNGAISQAPYTVSAWIYLYSGHVARGGVIFGNYVDATTPCVNFEIAENGVPRFYHINGAGEVVDLKFENVNVCADIWTNVTFTISGNSVSCYKNGVLIDTLTAENNIDLTASESQYALGGDLRLAAHVGSPNHYYFKGRILDVALFDKALSDTEVLQVYAAAEANETAPYTHYQLASAQIGENVADVKGNNNLIVKTPYFDKTPASDYAYSFAVIGDTQIVAENDVNNGENNLAKLYDWILENRISKNIQFVFGLGDITDNDVEAEWAAAQAQMQKLDEAGIAYSLVRGNHDMFSDTDFMTQYLGSEAYKSQFVTDAASGTEGGFYDESISNSWRTFTVGEINYLTIALDYTPSDELLAWAGDIIEAHPDHSVIITTHSYLYRDKTTFEQQPIWDDLVSKYENILLVLSGHYPSDTIVVSQNKGDHGNTVTSILVDPQHVDLEEGSTGMLAMLYFSEDGREVQVEYLSTVRAAENEPAYFREDNQFTLELFEEVLPDGLVATENGHRLEKDVTTDELTVDAGKTLDLNGYTLTVDNLACFGSIVDTSEGNTGALVVAELVISDMTYMPIYDSANGCYKFYTYELKNLGTRKNADGGVTYGFAIDFANTDAYVLLASSSDSGVGVTMNLAWGENSLPFAFSAELLQQYAALQVKYPAMRAAMMLTVTGLDTLESGAELTVTPAVEAAGQVSVSGEEMAYTVS